MMLILLTALASGCAKTIKTSEGYCDLTSTFLFDGSRSIETISKVDPLLFREILIHNEVREDVC